MKIKELPWLQDYEIESMERPLIELSPVNGWRVFHPGTRLILTIREPRIKLDFGNQVAKVKVYQAERGNPGKRSRNLMARKPSLAAR